MQLRFALLALALVPAAACGDDGGSHSDPPDAATPDARPDGPISGIQVLPGTADVPTCSTSQFMVDPAATVGAWSTSSGAVTATGLFTAPKTGTSATITFTPTNAADGAAAHATAHLAEAFPQPAVTVATNFLSPATPIEHTLVVNGARAYAIFPDGTTGVRVFRSDDHGATFAAKPMVAVRALNCAAAAVDAGNPDVVYLVVHNEVVDGETALSLYVSEDGGTTFPAAKRYIIADSVVSSLSAARCPDIASPSADHVVVATAAGNDDQTVSWAALYPSPNRGASFGTTGHGSGTSDYYSPSDTNRTRTFDSSAVLANGSEYGPRLASNGAGKVCTTYETDRATGCENTGCNAVHVQCSSDNGATWSAVKTIGITGAARYTTLAMAPNGNVAVSWLQTVSGTDRIEVAFSQDSGATFATPVSAPFDATTFGYTAQPFVTWEGNSILWVQETTAISDQPRIVIDKTCDFGASWGGELPITEPSEYEGTGIFTSGSKIVSVGRNLRDADNRPMALVQLTP